MLTKHVLVGGGTGFIGSRLVEKLANDSYKVTTVSRMPGPNRMTWHELESAGIPNDVSAVVNLAGQNVLDPTRRWTPGFKQNVWNSRINTTTTLAQAIAKSNGSVKCFVNISGVSHYKPNNEICNENDSCESFDFMSKLCVEWERAATISKDIQCRVVKIRSGVVLGKGGGMIQSIMLPFWLGLGGPMGSGNQPLPWIHINDLCSLIQFSIENGNVEGVLNGVAPEIITNAEFSKAFASALNRPALIPVPEFVVTTLFGKERAVLLLTGAKIKPEHTLKTGFKYQFPTIKKSCEQLVK